MLSVPEALAAVLNEARPLPPVRCGLDASHRCVLAEAVTAETDLPPFDKALVDGFALRAVEL